MKNLQIFFLALATSLCGCAQDNAKPRINNKPLSSEIKVGGGCEGCEAVYESPVSFEELNEVDTLPGFNEGGPQIEISGIIYKNDGKTPAPGIILYIYHTDQAGNYSTRKNDPQNAKGNWYRRHGYNRGWIKSGPDGSYKFYTLVPASYPNSRNPQHIHPTIKEPGKTEYWIDEFVFDDDPLLPEAERQRTNPRGGTGVLKTINSGGILKARRDIILGMNVPGYPIDQK